MWQYKRKTKPIQVPFTAVIVRSFTYHLARDCPNSDLNLTMKKELINEGAQLIN